MADIDVQRKYPTTWLWWVLGLIALAFIVWLVAQAMMVDDADFAAVTEEDLAAPIVTPEDLPPPGIAVVGLDEYMTTCADAPPPDMGQQHEYTANCIRHLSALLGAVIQGDTVANTAIHPLLEDFTRRAEAIQESDWQSTEHANQVRETFTSAAGLMETVQEQRYPGTPVLQAEVAQVRQAAEAIQPTEPLLEQSEAVQTFFREAGEAVRGLAERPAAARIY